MAAVASEIDSARNTPFIPQKCGNSRASGTSRNTLRSRAMNTEMRAAPRATNVFWQARCNPKILMPDRKSGITRSTVAIRRPSSVKAAATRCGKHSISIISTRLNVNIVRSTMRKHDFSLSRFPCP